MSSDATPHNLCSQVKVHSAASETALINLFTTKLRAVTNQLQRDQGGFTFAVSGGKSPTALFDALALCEEIDWNSARATLVDERYVNPALPDSNENLVRKHLCKGAAAQLCFTGLFSPERSCAEQVAYLNNEPLLPLPDIAILGLGMDGHTASLFPCSPEFRDNLATSSRYVKATPASAPHERISLSACALISIPFLWMYLPGKEKYQRLSQILVGEDLCSPIRTILAQRDTPLEIFTCP